MGAAMRFMDVGGGLAIDYDGSFTDTTASMAYSLQVRGGLSVATGPGPAGWRERTLLTAEALPSVCLAGPLLVAPIHRLACQACSPPLTCLPVPAALRQRRGVGRDGGLHAAWHRAAHADE